MTENNNDPSDEAFAEQLKSLIPASMTAETRSDDKHSLESMLYEAGFRAGCDERDLAGAKAAGSSTWMPMVAAGLLTAVLTVPLAYRLGTQSLGNEIATIAERDRSIPIDTADSLKQHSIEVKIDTGSQQEPPAVEHPLKPDHPLELFEFSQIARLWLPNSSRRGPTTETLTAFNRSSFESLPRSNWIDAGEDPMIPRQTMSAGDLGKFTLGLQVNQR